MYTTEWTLIVFFFFNWENSQITEFYEQNNFIEGGRESKSKTSLAGMASSFYCHPLHLWPLCQVNIQVL